tara:strand:- start:22 stop:270 length:249 start_codon:yes stop_codon:yes gene_type:complete
MTDKSIDLEHHLNCCEPDAIRFDGLDEAIVGSCHKGFLIYGYDKMLSIFEGMGMSSEEAVEWIEYNVIGTMGGEGFTVMFHS